MQLSNYSRLSGNKSSVVVLVILTGCYLRHACKGRQVILTGMVPVLHLFLSVT